MPPIQATPASVGGSILSDRLNRTVVSASAAVDAEVSRDLVVIIAGSDGLYGTVAGAQAAGNAIFTDFVCHCGTPPCFSGLASFDFHCSMDFENCNSFLCDFLRFLQGLF